MSSGLNKKLWIIENQSERSKTAYAKLEPMLKAAGFIFDEADPELVVTIGGDGTLLSAMHQYEEQLDRIRFVGVHTGHLGFYTDFMADELEKLVEGLCHEKPEQAVRYPLLRVEVKHDGKTTLHYALNESILRRTSQTMVCNVHISDELFEKFRGDGLAISTPTGSTAYNKSIGGAVMHPQVEAMQLAEIASLNNIVFRTLSAPMIVAKKDSIRLCPEKADDYSLTIDQLNFHYEDVTSVDYSLDGASIAFANCAHTPFWERVRTAFIGDGVE
ncbi:ATP-NAD kinase [Lactococcus termiticola]|uniref:NAD kinase n=1 Tax=Lactococcus termiticola TaxID=2169526 RepID=A0A2R5HFH6_9LACT|nr:NAD kinase [Lactococcus termiticola]GBG96055.1 ATP-NAD kinase [Lactococcus termiticola]